MLRRGSIHRILRIGLDESSRYGGSVFILFIFFPFLWSFTFLLKGRAVNPGMSTGVYPHKRSYKKMVMQPLEQDVGDDIFGARHP